MILNAFSLDLRELINIVFTKENYRGIMFP